MIAVLYKGGEEINRIVADEAFAAAYCQENGYTYELEPEPPAQEPEKTYSAEDMIAALLN